MNLHISCLYSSAIHLAPPLRRRSHLAMKGMLSMSYRALGEVNPPLLAQCPVVVTPPNASDLPVHITTWGSDGPPVFFVHGGVQGGIGGGPANFNGQRALADQGWQMRLIDRPGFGGSPSRGSDDMEADAALIAAQLGESSHLVGHSFGGAESLLAAALRPQALRSLVLIEPALQMMLLTDPDSAAAMASSGAADIVMKYMMSAPSPADYAIGFLGGLGAGSDAQDNVAVAGLKADRARATAMGCALLRARMAAPATARAAADAIAAAGIPVLVVSGSYSAGQQASCKAIARLTGGRHVVIDAPSHFLHQDSPAEFNAVLDAFLREAEARFASRAAASQAITGA